MDLYELLPRTADGQLGRYLGYFELKADGTLTFNTLISPPKIKNITRNGGNSTVTFSTVSDRTHRLRYTNAAGLATPISTWSIAGSITGTGSDLSLQHASSDAATFYAIEVQ